MFMSIGRRLLGTTNHIRRSHPNAEAVLAVDLRLVVHLSDLSDRSVF